MRIKQAAAIGLLALTPALTGCLRHTRSVLKTRPPDIVLSDVLMPKVSGVELGIWMRKELPGTRVVLISGQSSTAELLRRAENDGNRFELLPKPIHPEELIARLKIPRA